MRQEDRKKFNFGNQVADRKGDSQKREMRGGKENSLQTSSLQQQPVLGRAETRMRTELLGITGRWTDCGEDN